MRMSTMPEMRKKMYMLMMRRLDWSRVPDTIEAIIERSILKKPSHGKGLVLTLKTYSGGGGRPAS